MKDIGLSFVIPAKNEALLIGKCIDSISAFCSSITHEVIVVDNGSTDRTAQIASSRDAKVIHQELGTIGSLRNSGARMANGKVLVFLDADVTLTAEWAKEIGVAIAAIYEKPNLIAGSHCFAPPTDPRFFREWFNAFASEPHSRHIGTGHMIVGKKYFLELGGFDTSLFSGEDYEFCQRAEMNGAAIRNDPALLTYHWDFPKAVGKFVGREAWHGRGDLVSLRIAMHSKVVLATLLFAAIHVILLVALALACKLAVAIALLSLILLLTASSFAKFSHSGARVIINNAMVFYFYYIGRLMSFRYIGRARIQ